MGLNKICYPGQCEFLEFLSPSEGCYKTGGMKCTKYDRIVVKYDKCLDSKVEKELENGGYTGKRKEN